MSKVHATLAKDRLYFCYKTLVASICDGTPEYALTLALFSTLSGTAECVVAALILAQVTLSRP